MLTTLKQLQFKAPGSKPVERIAHVKPVVKQRKCEGCKDEYPAYDMEGNFCTECHIELQGQRLHEQEAAEEFNARRSANRVNRIADAETDEQRRERIKTHLEAEAWDAMLTIWNRQTAKKLGMI